MRLSGGAAALVSLTFLARFTVRRSNRIMQSRLDALRKKGNRPAPLSGIVDFKGVIHAHTLISHDSPGLPEELVRAAREAGLNFVVTTDHNDRRIFTEGIEGWFNDLLVIRGAEIGRENSSHQNEYLLAINIKEFIDGNSMGIQEIIDEIHHQGGLAFVAHTWRFKDWDVKGLDGMEVYDIADSLYGQAWKAPWMAFQVLTSWEDYSEEVFLNILTRPGYSLAKWDGLSQTRRLVGIAGNDAHQNLEVFGHQLDPYALDFKFVQTHILAPHLEVDTLLSALKAGHAYLSFGLLADATGFQFCAMKETLLAIMGDEVARVPGLVLCARTPQNGWFELYRNGRKIKEAFSDRLDYGVEENGVYRVEVSLRVGNTRYPWIISNPIYVI